MEDYSKYTPTDLLKIANDIKSEHEKIKKIIIDDTYEADNLKEKINENLLKLEELEKKYVNIVEEIDKRQ
jgi:predicted alternative tryptophan synthase beta-subunit